ncbi:MAG: PH domain-containing protein [Candidatus Saganbacteria bacterium]|nr:PH domain-containing protein [Candidatus Saganbacteria bacterium]
MDKEKQIFQISPKSAIYVPSMIFFGFIVLLFLLLTLAFFSAGGPCIIGGILFLTSTMFGALHIINIYLFPRYTKYALYDDSLVIQTGVIAKTKQTIPVNKLQDVTVSNGIMQKLFKCGNVFVETAGSIPKVLIENVNDPEEVAQKILSQVRKNKQTST